MLHQIQPLHEHVRLRQCGNCLWPSQLLGINSHGFVRNTPWRENRGFQVFLANPWTNQLVKEWWAIACPYWPCWQWTLRKLHGFEPQMLPLAWIHVFRRHDHRWTQVRSTETPRLGHLSHCCHQPMSWEKLGKVLQPWNGTTWLRSRHALVYNQWNQRTGQAGWHEVAASTKLCLQVAICHVKKTFQINSFTSSDPHHGIWKRIR